MKNTILITIFITIMAIGSTFAQDGFKLIGKLQGLTDGSKVTLSLYLHKQQKPMFEAIVENGTFIFTGKLEDPRLFLLGVEGTSGKREVILVENTTMSVSGKYNVDEKGLARFSDIVVKGSKLYDYFNEHGIKTKKALDQGFSDYRNNNKTTEDSLVKYKRGTTERNAYEQTDAFKKYNADEAAFFKNVDEMTNKVIADNSKTFWGPLFMTYFFVYFTPEHQPLFNAMSDQAKNSFYGKQVNLELFPSQLIGKAAPEFSTPDRDEKKYSLKDCLGKYTIIDFWASWCSPCRKEIPNLKNLYAKYHEKGFNIVSISLDKKDVDWTKALDEEQMPWFNLIDKDGISGKYSITLIPAMFIVDQNGKVVGEKLRGEFLVKKLKELLGE